MLRELHAARASPARSEFLAGTVLAGALVDFMLLVGVFASTPEILGSINGQIVEVPTLASGLSALDLAICCLMVLVEVVAEALRGRAHHLAFQSLRIVPRTVQSLRVHQFAFQIIICKILPAMNLQ